MNKRIMAVILMLTLLLSACGETAAEGKPENATGQNVTDAADRQLEWMDTSLPDADKALEEILSKEENHSLELLYGMADDVIYRVVWVYGEDIEKPGIYIQELKEPYRIWENTFIPADGWIDQEYGYVRAAALRQDGSVHMLLESMDDMGERKCYRAQWTESTGQTVEMLPDGEFSEELLSGISLLYADEAGTLYFVTGDGVQSFENSFSQGKNRTDLDNIWQIVERPGAEGQVFFCGTSKEGAFCMWTMEEQNPVFTSDSIAMDGSGRVALASGTDGYICTTDGVWKFQTGDGEPENVISFREQGYSVNKICGACVGTDGSLRMVLACDGELVLLESRTDAESDVGENPAAEIQGTGLWEPEGQEQQDRIGLELAASFPGSFLKETVVYFNRHNDRYYIILREPDKGESYTDFQTRIQAEVSGGGGPALLSDDVIDLENATEKEMLRDLTEDFAGQRDCILENVWSAGMVDDASYAIPYSFSVETFVTSMDIVGDKVSWTSGEMMQCVRNSGAETAVSNVDSPLLFSILVSHGDLIDWENGKSYLDSGEAVSMLEFAGEYGDKGSSEEMGVRIAEGKVLVSYMSLSGLFFTQTMEALFQGREAYIGLPADGEESGSKVTGDMLSVNQACEYPEGAVEFIQYLLTEERQERLAKDASENGMSGFPVSSQALEEMFGYAKELAEDPDAASGAANFMGYDYIREPLSAEGQEKVRILLQNARPKETDAEKISDIILEETPAYFSGSKSAQEVCDILQNRIQLYLDEMN